MAGDEQVRAGGKVDFDGLTSLFGFQIGIVHTLVTTRLEAQLRPLGLAPKLASVLWVAAANPGIPQSALTAIFGVNRTTINAFIRELKSKGLITLEQSPRDKRSYGIYLSEQGAALIPAMKASVLDFEARLSALAGEPVVARLTGLLDDLKAMAAEI